MSSSNPALENRVLESYVLGGWHKPRSADGRMLTSAVTGEPVAILADHGLDMASVRRYAIDTAGPELRAMTFHERAAILRSLGKYLMERKDELYPVSTATGATRSDSWFDIDGGIGVLLSYSSKARRELPDSTVLIDGEIESLARDGSFLGAHIGTSRTGVAVQINAFNFPCWGMLEKFAPAFLAGVPTIAKPASPTAYLTEALTRLIVESGLLPAGSLQVICGGTGDLLDQLDGQDSVAFTGSASTAALLRAHPTIIDEAVRFTAEADSLNCAILGAGAVPGSATFAGFVAEVVNEMTTKAGQKCTAIRRILVPETHREATIEALQAALADVVVGDPADKATTMGALAGIDQRAEVRDAVERLKTSATVITDHCDFAGVDPERGAFMAPTLLQATDRRADAIHQVEAFGPVSTVIGYDSPAEAVELAALGRGSLVTSVFTDDPAEAATLTVALGSHHGRIQVVDESSLESHTGHGAPLPNLVHGGPGRAGGGEELGGMRAVKHHLQISAVQASPAAMTAITGEYQAGAPRNDTKGHPFRLYFDDLEIGDSIVTDSRTVTLDDIERFAELTGDNFYAHMDDEAAKASPIFEGRVAHGYLVVSAAAGLFVDPDPGPVLANYGLDRLRFAKPTYPGDTLTVTLTCKRKTLRAGAGYGEVAWDTQVVNQNGEVAAAYDVLTIVATREQPS
ncbi:MAG: phenylacetic acid degradation bifunctional protein PaaZ [Acidimicrobiia bacterium]|nr:phenylacetic acid degradation bifunctional protein PaaZ [Acidimicrobiia bacterium]